MEYKNLDELVKDIKNYVRNNKGAQIVENDIMKEPFAICYKDVKTGKSWEILIKDLDKCIKSYPEKKRTTLQRAFQSQAGKEAFLEVVLKCR